MITFHNDDGGFMLLASPGGLIVIAWAFAVLLLLMYFVGLSVGRGQKESRNPNERVAERVQP